jgi:pimeloyl-ACP methyl ester carboxylesterase
VSELKEVNEMESQAMEKLVNTSRGISFWTEHFGSPPGTPLLLIMGAMNQGLFWPDAFCLNLARRGFLVIRYDHRDTGRSSMIDYAQTPYTLEDLTRDALAVLDGYGLKKAHVMGLSMGGYIAQLLTAHHPDRVDKLLLLSSSADHRPYMAATAGGEAGDSFLAPPAETFLSFIRESALHPPRTEEEIEDNMLAGWRATHGGSRPFPEEAMRALIRKSRERTSDPFAAFHHAAAVLDSPPRLDLLEKIVAPTLVLHGRWDPCLPLDHGRYLAGHIRGAQLDVLDMGHMFSPDMSEEMAERVGGFLGGQ